MRKSFVVFILFFVLSIMLVACGGETNTNSMSNASNEENDVNTNDNTGKEEKEDAEESEGESMASLPDGIPSDFPFPDGVTLSFEESVISGADMTIVSFSYTGEAKALYNDLKEYITNNGYTISIENPDNLTFSTLNDKTASIEVNITEASVNIVTITFLTPK
ncbi:hypothetical protein HNQ94_001001 [Salirhabdus euzebyi]|uniref:Lipoprotein n=1 Tax=Salirhabdus euzebyi TaxID=394506 RepID=A0A841PY76_9BACI|nr:hypothetical protein [Salirhabdus euzebyi]MBB6452556.1 hypothetical protein [Salirhabdus euzebyi]